MVPVNLFRNRRLARSAKLAPPNIYRTCKVTGFRKCRAIKNSCGQRNNFKESPQQLQWPRKRKRTRRKMEKRRRTNSQRYPESGKFYADRLKNRWSWSLSGSSSNSIPRGPSGDPAFDYLRVHTPLYTAILTYSGAISVNQRQKSIKSACTVLIRFVPDFRT
jgi:hypothetical protein